MRSAYKVKVMSVEEFRDNVSSKCEADSAVVLPPALLIRFYNQLLSVREGFSKKMRKSLVICQTGGGGLFFRNPPPVHLCQGLTREGRKGGRCLEHRWVAWFSWKDLKLNTSSKKNWIPIYSCQNVFYKRNVHDRL